MTGSSIDTQGIENARVEVDIRYKVTIAQSGIELEDEKHKESGKRELHRTTTSEPDVRDHIAKAHKLFKQEVIAASFGRVV